MTAAAFATVAATVATPGLSTALMLTLVGASGLVSVVRNGVQWGLLTEILPAPHYLLGRSLFTMSNGIMQMLGLGFGGLLVAVTSPRTTLLLAAAAHALSAAITLVGIGDHRPRARGERSIRTTWADNLSLFSQSRRRRLFVAMWVPNGLIVGCEALFVPYSPHWSGLLFAASAAGMLLGDVLVARVLSAAGRARSRMPLRLLLAVPYLAFALHPPIVAASALVLVASFGYGATLLLQEELLRTVPRSLTGHALGLHSCGLLAMQAVGATLAGTIAGRLSPALTMTFLALASMAVTLAVSPGKSQEAHPTITKEKLNPTVQRMVNVGVVVEDPAAATEFFVDLGLKVLGETTVEGDVVDRAVGLDGVRCDLTFLQAPDGHGQLELIRFHNPPGRRADQRAPANALGVRRIAFEVDDIDAAVGRLRARGTELLGEVVNYGDSYKLCYVRGPEGIILMLAEQIS